MAQIRQFAARSMDASRLRGRKYELVRKFRLPENLLTGLSPTHRRCGKSNCHCATGKGHLQWSVTLCREGRKRVERVPTDWVAELEMVVLESQAYLDAVKEVVAINVELLALTRHQVEKKKRTSRQRNRHGSPKRGQDLINSGRR